MVRGNERPPRSTKSLEFFLRREERQERIKAEARAQLQASIAASNELNRAIHENINCEQLAIEANGPINTFFAKKAKVESSHAVDNRHKNILSRCGLDPSPYPSAHHCPLVKDVGERRFLWPAVDCARMPDFDVETRSYYPKVLTSELYQSYYRREQFRSKTAEVRQRLLSCLSAAKDDDEIFYDAEFKSSPAPIFVLSGPPGVGKTGLAMEMAEHFGMRTIELNSNQIRNGKSFDPVLTTLNHKVGSSFFGKSGTKSQSDSILILIDEVDLLFEEDRGFWLALNNFLAMPRSNSTFIFLTSNCPVTYLQEELGIKLPPARVKFFTWADGVDERRGKLNQHVVSLAHPLDSSLDFELLSLSDERVRRSPQLEPNPAPEPILFYELERIGYRPPSVNLPTQPTLSGLARYLDTLSFCDLLTIRAREEAAEEAPLLFSNVSTDVFVECSESVAHELLNLEQMYGSYPIKQCDGPFRCLVARIRSSFNNLYFGPAWLQELGPTVIICESMHQSRAGTLSSEVRICSQRFKRRRRPLYRNLSDALLDEILL